VFSVISTLLSKLLAGKETKTVTEEELLSIIETIEDEGVLEPEKQALVNSAIEFRDKLAKDIMVPMEQVVCVSVATPIDELVARLQEECHSRLPVYEKNKHNIVGILPVNLFLSQYVTGKKVPLRKILLKPYIFDQETEISVLLQRMRLNKLHMVFLVDKSRKKVGILTMEDLLEELVGDIQDESDASEGVELL
jgi:CBS domain containing-hemolysin-like protein